MIIEFIRFYILVAYLTICGLKRNSSFLRYTTNLIIFRYNSSTQ